MNLLTDCPEIYFSGQSTGQNSNTCKNGSLRIIRGSSALEGNYRSPENIASSRNPLVSKDPRNINNFDGTENG